MARRCLRKTKVWETKEWPDRQSYQEEKQASSMHVWMGKAPLKAGARHDKAGSQLRRKQETAVRAEAETAKARIDKWST